MTKREVVSKTGFMVGLQCPLQQWLRVNGNNAPEFYLDEVSWTRMESGNRVDELASDYFPGGIPWKMRESFCIRSPGTQWVMS